MHTYKLKIIIFIAIFLVFISPLTAQEPDTLDIPGNNVGVINKTIMGDTTATGERNNVNRVYRLERGKIYYFTGHIAVRFFNLTIMADEEDPDNPLRPPLIAPAILQDDSSPSYLIALYQGNCTLKNLYLNGFRPDQRPLNSGTALYNGGAGNRIIIDNCVFDGWSGSATTNMGIFMKMYIRNCKFRNMLHPNSWFFAHVASSWPNPVDTLILLNNTMFSCGGYFFCPNRDLCKYARVEHNTLFLNHVNPLYCPHLSNAVIRNNLFYGMISMGITESERIKGYFDWKGAVSSIASIDTMPTDVANKAGITESERRIDFSNNIYFWPQKIKDFWTITLEDTVYKPSWMNTRTQNIFNDDENYPYLIAENNLEADPQFPASVTSQVDSLLKYCYKTRSHTQTDYRWWYNPDNDLFGPQWPLPEDLAYTNEELLTASDLGLPVGDLNWFPEQKAIWEEWEEKKSGLLEKEHTKNARKFELYQNYPNPFNAGTVISYRAGAYGNTPLHIELSIYNLLGQKITTLVSERQSAGSYQVEWDATDFASGVYYYRLTTSQGFTQTKKLVLIR